MFRRHSKQEPLHTIVEHILRSEPVNADICYMLEKSILDAAEILDSSMYGTPLELMEYYLCQDKRNATDSQREPKRLGHCGCAVIAECMDSYICKVSV